MTPLTPPEWEELMGAAPTINKDLLVSDDGTNWYLRATVVDLWHSLTVENAVPALVIGDGVTL